MPGDPERLVERDRDRDVDDEVDARDRRRSHGRCRLKNVRVSSRLTPENGSENENQKSAVETSSVDDGAERAVLVDRAA